MNEPLKILPSLNALRFFAFFYVFLLHIPGFEGNQFLGKTILAGNASGVDFFFTLSGFLITYLLFNEKLANANINGRKYFLRRSLRIWPLYFLAVGIAYFNNYITQIFHMGNADGYVPNPLFSVTFLENYQMIRYNNFPNGAPLRIFWSLCVEEHFYFIWFLLFTLVSLKNLYQSFIVLWIIGIAYRIGFHVLFPDKMYDDIDVISKMDFFCAGGFSGLLIASNFDRIKTFFIKTPIYLRYIGVFIFVFLFYSNRIFPGLPFRYIYAPALSAILYSLLLLVVTTTKWVNFKETSVFSRLGKISYGLYVFHTLVIVTLLFLFKLSGINTDTFLMTSLFAFVALSLSVVISALSYRFFEKPFLQLKSRYQVRH